MSDLVTTSRDALAEVTLTDAECEALGPFIWGGWIGVAEGKEAAYSHDLQATVGRIVAARVAEAADAREVEVRVETWDAALRWVRQWAEAASPEAAIKNIDRAEPFNPYRAALAPADNDGEASRG